MPPEYTHRSTHMHNWVVNMHSCAHIVANKDLDGKTSNVNGDLDCEGAGYINFPFVLSKFSIKNTH